MFAFLVCLAALAYWTFVGYGLLTFLGSRRQPVRTFLLAPAAGLALNVCCLIILSRAGLPIRAAAWPCTLALLALAGAALYRRRPTIAPVRIAPFAGIALAAILLAGWPMLRFGFDWVSYANDDMANYALWGNCLKNHAWDDPIPLTDLTEGRDLGRSFSFLYSYGGYRPGAELSIAWLSSLSGKTTLAVAMPLLLALHGALILAAGGLVFRGRSRRLAALAACALLAVSAPLTLGTLNQLLGQNCGLPVLCCGAALLFRQTRPSSWRRWVPRVVLLGVILAGMVINYCELLPFVGLGFVVYAAVSLVRRRSRLLPIAGTLAGAFAVALLILNRYFFVTIGYLTGQVRFGAESGDEIRAIFPYYLHPSGLASLWSFQTFESPLSEPYLSLAIAAGAVLLLLTAWFAVRLAWRGQPVAVLCLVLLAMAAVLCFKGSAFALFKLAMYAQPFLLGTLALRWSRLGRLRWLAVVPLAAFAWGAVQTQQDYTRRSFGANLLVGQNGASEEATFRRLQSQLRDCDADHLIVATDSTFFNKITAMLNEGRSVRLPLRPITLRPDPERKNPFVPSSEAERLLALSASLQATLPRHEFHLHDPARPDATNAFTASLDGSFHDRDRTALVCPSGRLNLLNRRRLQAGAGGFQILPLSQVVNYLTLVDSELGHHHYYSFGSPDVAAYQLEPDFFFPGRTMAGLGRHVLFEVLEPTPAARVLVDLTASLAANGDCRLPDAAVIGRTRVKLPLTGRGAARVVAESVEPQEIAGNHYLALDLGDHKFQFRPQPSRWDRFAKTFVADRRRLTSFGRDVSLLSEKEFESLKPPTMLSQFPADLAHPDLEFSGLYEDGWLSEHAWFRPSCGAADAELVVEGMVPLIENAAFRTTITVLVDGREIIRRELPLGDFTIRAALSGLSSRPKVELIFSDVQRLPEGDGRVVVGQLRRLGFEPARTAKAK